MRKSKSIESDKMGIRAVIFDFDGVCIDTETARYMSYKKICRDYGFDLPIVEWIKNIGKASWVSHPFDLLERETGYRLNRAELESRHRIIEEEIADEMPLSAGLLERLNEAKSLGILLGIASSSSHRWVDGHLKRRDIIDFFDVIICKEDTVLHKPDPAPYKAALDRLGIVPANAIAVEDSEAGLASAKAAGLYCIAIPGNMTNGMDLGKADRIIKSLEEVSWRELSRIL